MSHEDKLIIYATWDGATSVALYARDGNIWMNQGQIAELFETSIANISMHIKHIFAEGESHQESVIQDYLTTATDGKNYEVRFYSLAMILAIGFRVRSKRGTQFRIWANQNLREYMIKWFIMDDERLKNPDGRPDYFDELLTRIRDIRSSEKRFYQKLKDLFALSADYDATDSETHMFFAETQNKILYAITWQTAAEIIVSRADELYPNMSLTSWRWDVVRKEDIYIAKNYLTSDELDSLNRFVSIFLEVAEFRAKDREVITMSFWRENRDKIILLNDKKLLHGAGSISHEDMKKIVEQRYEIYVAQRGRVQSQQADNDELSAIEQLEKKLKKK